MDRARRKKVEVLYFQGCPNHRQAVELTRKVVSEIGVDAEIEEVEVKTLQDAARVRFLGSPSVRVDGVDIEPGARNSTAYGLACRTYGRDVVPSRELLVAALREEREATPVRSGGRRSWRARLSAFSGAGALLLPVAKCPACWPAYAGFLSSAGLGFLLHERYLLPVAATLLTGALASLAYRVPSRRGYGPFWLGLGSALVALGGKFALSSDPLLYIGFGFFVLAAGWNAWPHGKVASVSCEPCAPQEGRAWSNPSARVGRSS